MMIQETPLVRLPPALRRWLVPETDKLALRWFIVLLAAIWVVGFLLRMRWLIDYGWDAEPVQWNGTPLLTSADGYYFAAGVQAAVAGDAHGRIRIPEPGEHALVALGWLIVKLLGVSTDQYAVYMPAIVGPLIAAPIALIGRFLQRSAFGLVAALLMVVTPSFFVRSSAGYFDSDVFALSIPLLAIAFFVRSFTEAPRDACRPPRSGRRRSEAEPEEERGLEGRQSEAFRERRDYRPWGVAGAALIAAYPFFYDQGGSLGTALAAVICVYLAIFHRKDPWALPLMAALGLSQLAAPWWLCTLLAIAVPLILTRLPLPRPLALALPLLLMLLGFILSPAWTQMLQKLAIYAGGPRDLAPTEGAGDGISDVVFRDSTRFVAEAQKIELAQAGQRIIGWLPLAALSAIGAALLVLGQRVMLILAPIAGIGFVSLWGSLRFTIYLSPVAALGAAWIVVLITSRITDRMLSKTSLLVLALLFSVPGFLVCKAVRPKPSIIQPEVASLVELGKRMKPGDTVVSWWDYGYAIGYFTEGRTVVDGGRRFQDANLAAEMLTGTSQLAAVNLARTATYWLEKRPLAPAAPMMFKLAKDRGVGPNAYLAELARADAQTPEPPGDIYFYLPARMLGILPAIDQLRPMEKGEKRPMARGAAPQLLEADGERLVRSTRKPDGTIEKETIVDGKKLTVKTKKGTDRPLRRIFSIAGGGGKPVDAKMREGNPKAQTIGLFLRRIGIFAEMEQRLVDSVFVQLFAFEKPEPGLLELVFANDAAKIYRVRR